MSSLSTILYHQCLYVTSTGVIYLKNMVCQFWEEKEVAQVTDPAPFCIHETDKVFIREHIVEAVISAPEPVRYAPVIYSFLVDNCILLQHENYFFTLPC